MLCMTCLTSEQMPPFALDVISKAMVRVDEIEEVMQRRNEDESFAGMQQAPSW